ncbi:MAG TPA: hydrogenase nickel incorporation protein HypA [Opitutaceae bacterium]|nr:hydrogenase nickel incorporation protein HypA [Opitutaceae bacterium]
MFTVDLTIATVVYTGLGFLTVAVLWVWSDRRDRQFYDATRRRTTFHCIKCTRVYTSTESREVSRCPVCGHENTRLKF